MTAGLARGPAQSGPLGATGSPRQQQLDPWDSVVDRRGSVLQFDPVSPLVDSDDPTIRFQMSASAAAGGCGSTCIAEMTSAADASSPSHPREGTGNDGNRWATLGRKHPAQTMCSALTCIFTPDSKSAGSGFESPGAHHLNVWFHLTRDTSAPATGLRGSG